MAYTHPTNSTAPNPPVLAFQPMAFGRSAIGSTTYGAGSSNVGGNVLALHLSTHLQTDVGTSDFIADGSAQLGMKKSATSLMAQLAVERPHLPPLLHGGLHLRVVLGRSGRQLGQLTLPSRSGSPDPPSKRAVPRERPFFFAQPPGDFMAKEKQTNTDDRGQPTSVKAQTVPFAIPKRAPRANQGKFDLQNSGARFNTWLLRAEYGTALETLLLPDYWAHVAGHLKPFDRIEVIPEGGLNFAELIVLAVDESGNTARVRPLRVSSLYDLKAEDLETGTHKVTYRGEIAKWGVQRKDDGAVMKDGFITPDDAVAFMKDHLKAFAA
jgi:hypothetical protein